MNDLQFDRGSHSVHRERLLAHSVRLLSEHLRTLQAGHRLYSVVANDSHSKQIIFLKSVYRLILETAFPVRYELDHYMFFRRI
jgi:hypothetical protein